MKILTLGSIVIVMLFIHGCTEPGIRIGDDELRPEDLPMPVPRKDIFVNYGEHPFCSNIKFASNDFDHYDGVHNTEYYDAAKRSFRFAWMSSNAYEDYDGKKPQYVFSRWIQVGEKVTTWRGMGAHVYLSEDLGKVVIAFEGTNFDSPRDWFFGNLNLFWKGQYNEAYKLAKNVKREYPKAKIITTGHSLGGGLAIHVALKIDGVETYAFNSSPRVFAPDRIETPNSSIVLISENNEALNKIRAIWSTLDGYEEYSEFDFLNTDILTEHSIYYIGRGLAMVAASTDDPFYVDIAESILRDNKGHLREKVVCPT